MSFGKLDVNQSPGKNMYGMRELSKCEFKTIENIRILTD